jgi:hypothetical protein
MSHVIMKFILHLKLMVFQVSVRMDEISYRMSQLYVLWDRMLLAIKPFILLPFISRLRRELDICAISTAIAIPPEESSEITLPITTTTQKHLLPGSSAKG